MLCRVGNLLGSSQPQQARLSGLICIVSSVAFMALAAIAIFASRHVIGYIFSADPLVIATVAVIAPYAALFQVG
jgi:MATE family multidrug resistance protein